MRVMPKLLLRKIRNVFFHPLTAFSISPKKIGKKKKQKSTQYSKSNKVESRIRKIKVIPITQVFVCPNF